MPSESGNGAVLMALRFTLNFNWAGAQSIEVFDKRSVLLASERGKLTLEFVG